LIELEILQLQASADASGGRSAVGSVYDVLGLSASTLCTLHCGLFPLLLTAYPQLAMGFLAEEGFEWTMIGLSLAIGAFALTRGYRLHHRKLTAFLVFRRWSGNHRCRQVHFCGIGTTPAPSRSGGDCRSACSKLAFV
jgi:hypothetical protein